jgi:hypothetical protein
MSALIWVRRRMVAGLISSRTKTAPEAAKARGEKLGGN